MVSTGSTGSTGEGRLDIVRPTHEDPMLRGSSAMLGGPAGAHAGHHRWWTPIRVLLVITAVCCALGMVQKAGCFAGTPKDQNERYAQMCYSDLPALYIPRGLVELDWPYSTDPQVRSRYQVMEYPVGIAYVAWGTAALAQAAVGGVDRSARAALPVADLGGAPGVTQEIRWFVVLSALLFALCALASTWLLAGVRQRRPWDAALFAASPALAVTALINWDLFAVVVVAGALFTWSRRQPVLTGVLIGVGVAMKLYPLFLLGALLVICLRRRRLADFGLTTLAAVLTWGVLNAPAYVVGPGPWKVFWTFNSERGPDLGSLWLLVANSSGNPISAHTVNLGSWAFFGAWCVGVLVLGLKAPVVPRFDQLGLLILVGFLLVNKVYSPQYVLWLLPLAVMALPRWREQLIWQSTELFYFAAVWWYLGGFLAPSGTDGQPAVYWAAILLRMLGELYLVAMVIHDLYRPQHDPVWRTEQEGLADGFEAGPGGPPQPTAPAHSGQLAG